MRFEDIKKLATGTILFDLNRIIAPRMVTIVYLLGLAAILLWAINHFFYSFAFGFGNGLWGLLEIAVFGLLALVVLRIACEAVIVYFRAHQDEAAQITHVRTSASLIDDVREAIEELADEEPDADETEYPVQPAADTPPAPPPAAPAPTAPVVAPRPAAKPAAKASTGSKAKARPKPSTKTP